MHQGLIGDIDRVGRRRRALCHRSEDTHTIEKAEAPTRRVRVKRSNLSDLSAHNFCNYLKSIILFCNHSDEMPQETNVTNLVAIDQEMP